MWNHAQVVHDLETPIRIPAARGIGLLRFSRRTVVTLFLACLLTIASHSALQAQTFNVRDFGAIGDGTTDDTAAIQEAVEAAGSAGGGTVHFPCGQYRVGATGYNRFFSGIQVTYSNVVLSGPPSLCAELLPGFTWGGVLVAACPEFVNLPEIGANSNCDATSPLESFTIRNLSFRDDAPNLHCKNYGLVAPGGCVSEETHGITVSHTNSVLIENNRFEALGDESITILSPGIVRGNEFINTPGEPPRVFRRLDQLSPPTMGGLCCLA